MLIKSLKLKNFRQFKGEININFSYSPKKNVTIILGDNTYGKTTLLQAFNWCFYKTVNFDHNPKFLLNYELSEEMLDGVTNIVSVEVTIIHDNIEYILKRTQEYTKIKGKTIFANENPLEVWRKVENGALVLINGSPETWINEVLPKDLSTYFFFDTERVNSISHKENISESVKGLLGLSALSKTIEHLGTKNRKDSVIGKFQQELDTDNEQDSAEIEKAIQDNEFMLENICKQIDETKKNKERYESRKEELDKIIHANSDTKKMQEEEKRLENKIRNDKKYLEENKKEIYNYFYKLTKVYFEKPLIKEALASINTLNLKDDRISGLSENILRKILDRGICICGSSIKKGSSEYNCILKEIQNISGDNLYDEIKNFKYKLEIKEKNNYVSIKEFKRKYEDRLKLQKNIEDDTCKIEEIRKAIKDKEDMRKYEIERAQCRSQIRLLQEKLNDLYENRGECNNNQKILEKEQSKLISKTDHNRKIYRYINYAEALLEWIEENQKEKAKEIKDRLEEKINDIFNQIYSGKRIVKIDDKYKVNLITKVLDNEYDTGKSEGLDRVKNFAFIGGLVSLAKEKIVSKAGDENIDLSSEPYPLVMDAPFSNADEGHTARISKVLPDVAEQVIMFVMQKDYKYAEIYLEQRIGKKYKLEKYSEIKTSIIELDS